MRQWGGGKRMLRACVLAVLLMSCTALAWAALSDACWPVADGATVKSDGGLMVDASHANDGYLMVKGPETSKRLKLRVKFGDQTLDYDLNGNGEYEVIPLQLGSGKYACTLYKNASGKKYAQEGKVTVKAELADENSAFLYPNMYVDYNQDTPAVRMSEEICQGLTTQRERYDAIFQYITNNFAYDFVKMVTVKPGMLPDIDDCFDKRMGICQDLSAVSVCMLRVQGIPAKLMIGTLGNGTYHAWVVAVVDGQEILFDPTAELSAVAKEQEYTIERFY